MNPRLRPATRDELRDTLDHALRYGRSGNPRRYTSDIMARIAADILVDHLERSGIVALSKSPVSLVSSQLIAERNELKAMIPASVKRSPMLFAI